jgi:hypothetical protein
VAAPLVEKGTDTDVFSQYRGPGVIMAGGEASRVSITWDPVSAIHTGIWELIESGLGKQIVGARWRLVT